ncbi:MAG: 50S ribosomal protein L5 [Candidatus Pacebacteria bacterium]|nr:50S ribosomal protein L5 [Candidatus Paceibacterota bacterium]
MNRLKKKYQEEVAAKLKKELGIDNIFSVPKLEKLVLNMGVSDFPQNPRNRMKNIENIVEQFRIITGQHPQVTKAKKSIAGFKLREGEPLGVMVTLRGEKMWEFVDKLISTALPRVRDFQGVSRTAFDGQGNYNLGISEQIVFPEINYDTIESIRGLQITFVTNTKSNEHAFALLEALGMPFAKENK